jgi:hypothetical protein
VDFALLQCPFCGLLQLDCPPVPYYREVLRAAAVSPEMDLAPFLSRAELAENLSVE